MSCENEEHIELYEILLDVLTDNHQIRYYKIRYRIIVPTLI